MTAVTTEPYRDESTVLIHSPTIALAWHLSEVSDRKSLLNQMRIQYLNIRPASKHEYLISQGDRF